MKSELLSNVLNDIDERYLIKCETARSRKQTKRPGRIMLYASAAVILLAVIGAGIHGWQKHRENPGDPDASPSGPVAESSLKDETPDSDAADTASRETTAIPAESEDQEDTSIGTGTPAPGVTLIVIPDEAAMENSALSVYCFDGENTVRRFIFDKETKEQILCDIAGLKAKAAGQEKLKEWQEPCYALGMDIEDGKDIRLTYSDGIWLDKDGSVSLADFDLAAVFNNAPETHESIFESGLNLPNAAILGKSNNAYYKKVNEDKKTAGGVTAEIKSLSEDGIFTCEITNHSGSDYVFGMGHTLEKKVDGIWYTLPPAVSRYEWSDILCILEDGHSTEFQFPVWVWGELEPGEYRIAVDAEETVYAAFTR